jgi:putative hemolysin
LKEEAEPQQIEQEILQAVEEGAKEGIVDEEEKEMIESVIQFRATQVGQIMTARPEIIGLDIKSTLAEVKHTVEETGHSRIPVYDGTLDHIVGILYARDLLRHLGLPADKFDIRTAMRPAFYVPETKPLRDLLRDFRLQKVHMAIVLDEYGGTAGLISIEDILEELVGEISDEHEAHEPAMLIKQSETTAEADARIYIDELNRTLGLNLPDDAGYDTLGGFISTTLGRIPEPGESFEHASVKYTITDAEPQKVNRVKIEILTPEPAAEEAPSGK